MRKILLLALTLAVSSAWAHGHDDDGTGELNVEHFAEMMALAPGTMVEDSHTTAYVDIGKTRYYMNGPFWRMTQGWIRQYYRELSKECEIDWSEEKFTQAATDAAAKSFVGEKVLDPLIEGIEHIAVGTVDIAAEEGAVAGGLKLTAEVAETGASKAVGGMGMHVACHLIDATILFGTRHIQTAGRAFFWSKQMDRSSLPTLLKMAYVARAAGRVQNRVQFVAGPVEIDEGAMHEVDLEGPSRWMSRKKDGTPRWWGRLFRITDGKRAKWVQDLAQANGKPLVLAGKSFMGSQAYYTLFLKGRKLGYPSFMKGKSSMDKTLGRSMLWILSAQSIAQRSFKDEGKPIDSTFALAEQRTPVTDDIRRGLAEEFASAPEQADVIEMLLREVDVIFQPDVPSTVRYAHAQVLEAYIYGFMYGRYKSALEEKSEIYPAAADGYWQKFLAIGSMIKFRWRAGFGQPIQKWGDFLKLAALQNDPKRLSKHRYEMQEGLLRIFRIMQAGATVAGSETPEDLAAFKEVMRSEYKYLKTFTPWREKREGFFWIPVKPALDWIPTPAPDARVPRSSEGGCLMRLFLAVLTVMLSSRAQAHQARNEVPPLEPRCEDLLEATPLDREFAAASIKMAVLKQVYVDRIPNAERSYFDKIVAAAEATMNKHHPLYLDKKQLKQLNIPRHLTILRAIAALDESKLRFSLYRIKRAIEGQHSLREYTNCY